MANWPIMGVFARCWEQERSASSRNEEFFQDLTKVNPRSKGSCCFRGINAYPMPDFATNTDKEASGLEDMPKFVGIDALLSSVGSGIGAANRQLVANSSSTVGTLAVKSADVKLQFELSSTSTENGLVVPKPGAKTITFGTERTQVESSNKCEINLHIVSVAEPAEVEPKVKDPAHNAPDIGRRDLSALVTQLSEKIRDSKLSPTAKKRLLADLRGISELLASGKGDEAGSAFKEFLQSNEALLKGMMN